MEAPSFLENECALLRDAFGYDACFCTFALVFLSCWIVSTVLPFRLCYQLFGLIVVIIYRRASNLCLEEVLKICVASLTSNFKHYLSEEYEFEAA